MKILIVSDAWHPQVNGVVRTYEYLKQELEALSHKVFVIGPDQFNYKFPMPGYNEIQLVLWPFKSVAERIYEIKPDIVHIATEGPLGWAARKYCLKHNIGFSTCYHTQFPDYLAKRIPKFIGFLKPWFRQLGINLIKKFHAPSKALLVTTQSMTAELKSWGINVPISFFTRGTDSSVFYPAESHVLDSLPRPIALYVGRLAVEKNIEEFLAMLWTGSKVVIGHGPDSEALKAKFPDAHFLGKKTGDDLADHYRAADVFIFPSLTDTFGMVIIEALACGLPVAAHRVIGPQDIITQSFLGVLGDDLSIAATQAIKSDKPQQRYDFIKTNYTWKNATEQFLACHQIETASLNEAKLYKRA